MRFFYCIALFLSILKSTLALSVSPRDLRESYVVKDLPGLSDIPENVRPVMHAGHLELYANNNTNYFFWKFSKPQLESDKTTKLHNNQLVFWLNGGPGCSSMDGALMELGPLRISDGQKVLFNSGSWMEVADIVFVDQPGGTGLSYTDAYDIELGQVAYDFTVFLKKYFELFPDDIKKEVWIAGESYAGQYIPYVSSQILQENDSNNPIFGNQIDLKGLLIGNGWIDPNLQSLSYVPFGLDIGLLDQSADYMPKLLKQHERCQKVINSPPSGGYMEDKQCEKILDLVLSASADRTAPKDHQCINMYDYRLYDSYPSCGMNWPPDLVQVEPFLNQKGVQESLNMKKAKSWSECDNQVGRFLRPKTSKPAVDLLPALLERLPIVLFSGEKDIICNTLSTELIIERLIWNNNKGYTDEALTYNWIYDDTEVGEIISERNLTFVKVYNSSHMVPFDLPEVSRGLFDVITNAVKISKDKSKLTTPVYDVYNGTYYFEKKDLEAHKQINQTVSSTVNSSNDTSTSTGEDDSSSESSNSLITKDSWTFFFFELIVVLIILYAIRHFYCLYFSKPSSILANPTKNKKNKSVHWSDTLESPEPVSKDNLAPQGQQNVLTKVLNKLGYSNTSNAYNDLDEEENSIGIEMNGIDDQFIIQSDEEDFDRVVDEEQSDSEENRVSRNE